MTAGPKTEYLRDAKGEPVVGLRIQPETDAKGQAYETYYAKSDKGKRKRFGSSRDKPKAIHRFRIWEGQGESEPFDDDQTGIHFGPTAEGKIYWADYFRRLIYSNPKQAATELDCEPLALLANVDNLKPLAPPKRLTELCDTYLDDKTLSPKEAGNSRTWWDEFQAITKAKVVTDLDRAAFKRYRKTIKERQGDLSNVWRRSRFGKIKTIVNHALVEMELTTREKSILSDVALLKLPPKPSPKPADISPRQMKAILSNADKWEKALTLLALNAAYKNKDCKRLRWDMINWEDGTIRFDRTKSERLAKQPLPRICSLWKRTIRALKAIKNGHTHVFLSTQGQPAHIDTINDHFVKCCKTAGVQNRTFEHLRKSALTAASNDPKVPDRQIELLAGHSSGIKEHYVVRKNVQLACEAIERYYFGGKKAKSSKS